MPRDKRPLKDRFGKGDIMESAQRLVDMQRQNFNYLSKNEYCGAPPMGLDLFHVCSTRKEINKADSIRLDATRDSR